METVSRILSGMFKVNTIQRPSNLIKSIIVRYWSRDVSSSVKDSEISNHCYEMQCIDFSYRPYNMSINHYVCGLHGSPYISFNHISQQAFHT